MTDTVPPDAGATPDESAASGEPGRAARRRRLLPRPRLGLGTLCLTCAAIIAVCVVLQLTQGQPTLSIGELIDAIRGDGVDRGSFVVQQLRAPRIVAGVVIGAALGAAGVLMQDSLRNPLADPSLLGVAQGASFAVAVGTFYPELAPPIPRPILALMAGTTTGLLVVAVAGRLRDPVRLLLAGAVASSFFGTLTGLMILFAPESRLGNVAGYQRFLIGSLSTIEWESVWRIVPWSLPAIPLVFIAGRMLNVLKLGDDVAVTMGLDPGRARIGLLVVAMALVAPGYAFAGPIAFVALLAPHIARGALRSSDARPVLVGAAVLGATQLIAADAIGRLLLFPTEIPAGIWTIAIAAGPAMWFVGRIRRTAAP
ncbi:MAG: iron ABC transporter permease [Actinomycetota bacterium]